MKRIVIFFGLFSFFLAAMAMETLACHSKDLGTINKGHYIWSKDLGGISRMTESSTISLFTSTNCNLYTAFILDEYEMLAEEASKGQGEHLVALTRFAGCPEESADHFSQVLQASYDDVFIYTEEVQAHQFQHDIEDMIAADPGLSKQCGM